MGDDGGGLPREGEACTGTEGAGIEEWVEYGEKSQGAGCSYLVPSKESGPGCCTPARFRTWFPTALYA